MPNAQTYRSLHEKFLQNNQPKMYQDLQRRGELETYLDNVGQDAAKMFDLLSSQMAKTHDPVHISLIAEEIVMSEVVYQPLPRNPL